MNITDITFFLHTDVAISHPLFHLCSSKTLFNSTYITSKHLTLPRAITQTQVFYLGRPGELCTDALMFFEATAPVNAPALKNLQNAISNRKLLQ
mmetsp:Transcript_47937/g.93663  ORF Transcript_47937/g.93663 Transcript_47937/m.93663 type:complete len:94 (-) Transcript_47937:80-361(-)